MSQISFVPKACFRLFDRILKITDVIRNNGQTNLEVVDEDGAIHVHSQEYLLDQYSKRNLRAAEFVKEDAEQLSLGGTSPLKLLSDLNDSDREEGVKNAALFQAIVDEGGFLRGNTSFWSRRYHDLCKEYGFAGALDRSTIQRWAGKVRSCIDAPLQYVLAPKNDLKGGRGKIRMSEEVEKIVETCVQDVYLSSENTPLTECYQELVKRITQENEHRHKNNKLKLVSYAQLRRYVLGIDAYEVHASRFGRASAEKKFKISRKTRRRLNRALERVEVDHTPLDIFVVDVKGETLGRAYLTVVVDKKTKVILGFNLGFEGPSVMSVLRALKHAVSPKSYLKEKFPEVVSDWPMFGLIELLAMDNGSELHATALKCSVMDMDIVREMVYMPRAKPFFKGLVENKQGILNRGISSGQPGATMSHFWQRNKERKPEEYAVHTLESLHRMLHIWICDVYHQTVNKELKTTPYKAWMETTALMPVRLAPNRERLDLVCTLPITRKLQAYGVEVCYLRTFMNDELKRLMRRYMHAGSITVEVRYKPYKLDKIWVKDPDKQTWFVVENYDSETRNTTAWQQEQVERIMREEKNETGAVISRANAQAKLRAIGTELLAAKTMAKRRKALKMLGLLTAADLANTLAEEPEEKEEKPKTQKAVKGKATSKASASNAEPVLIDAAAASPTAPTPIPGGYIATETFRVL